MKMYRINQKLDMNAGVHALYLALNNSLGSAQGLVFLMNLNDKNRFNIALGLHGRGRTHIYLYSSTTWWKRRVLFTKRRLRELTRAFHAAAGHTWRGILDSNFSLRSEVYLQAFSAGYLLKLEIQPVLFLHWISVAALQTNHLTMMELV